MSHGPSDPVEMRRIHFQTAAMISHPPIPVGELAAHIERLKADDNALFAKEYEVRFFTIATLHFSMKNSLFCFSPKIDLIHHEKRMPVLSTVLILKGSPTTHNIIFKP